MRRSYFTYDDVIIYLDEPVKSIFSDKDADEKWTPKLDINGIPEIEKVIVPEEDKIISMGFPCIKECNLALLPIVAAFIQYSLIQRSNQQLNIPYSQITQSYHDAILFLEKNKDMCFKQTNTIANQIRSVRRRRINAGF